MSYTDYYKELCPSEEAWVHRQLSNEREEFEKEISKLRAEVEEQCLLNGKGSEREAALLGKLERAERDRNNLRVEVGAAMKEILEKQKK